MRSLHLEILEFIIFMGAKTHKLAMLKHVGFFTHP